MQTVSTLQSEPTDSKDNKEIKIFTLDIKNLQVCFCNFTIFLTSTQDLMKTQWPGSDKNNKEAIEKARLISPSGLKPTCEIQEIVFYKKKANLILFSL